MEGLLTLCFQTLWNSVATSPNQGNRQWRTPLPWIKCRLLCDSVRNVWDEVSTHLLIQQMLRLLWAFQCRNVSYYIFNVADTQNFCGIPVKKRPLQKSSRTDKITYLRPTKTAISKSHLLVSGCYRLSVKSHPRRWLIPVDIRWSPVMVIFPSFSDSEACKPLAAEANSEWADPEITYLLFTSGIRWKKIIMNWIPSYKSAITFQHITDYLTDGCHKNRLFPGWSRLY